MQFLKWSLLVLAALFAWRLESQVAHAQGCTAARGCPSLPPSLPGGRGNSSAFNFNLNSQRASSARNTPAPVAASSAARAPSNNGVMAASGFATSAPQVLASTVQGSATIRVQVPKPDAKLWFQGAATKKQGSSRVFKSPQLDGGSFRYLVRCVWTEGGREVSQEKYVTVGANQQATVDFSSPQQVAQR